VSSSSKECDKSAGELIDTDVAHPQGLWFKYIPLQFCLETGRGLSDLLIGIPGQGAFVTSLVYADKCYG